MAFTIDELRSAARDLRQRTLKSDDQLLRESRDTSSNSFDIFLSHSSRDKELVLGAKKVIEGYGHSVYVDWIDDAQRDAVFDRKLASRLRVRMRQCESLFYLHTPNAALSKWCPWELGFFDGLRSPEARVFVLPVTQAGQSYKGQEYLDLYDVIDLRNWARPPRIQRTGGIDPFEARMLADRLGMLWRPGTIL